MNEAHDILNIDFVCHSRFVPHLPFYYVDSFSFVELWCSFFISCCSFVLFCFSMESVDPQTMRFMQQLQAETQRQKFTEQVHTLTGRCWDVCLGDYRPPSKMDGKTQTCMQNCVNRMIDASNFMVEHLQKMEGGKGMI